MIEKLQLKDVMERASKIVEPKEKLEQAMEDVLYNYIEECQAVDTDENGNFDGVAACAYIVVDLCAEITGRLMCELAQYLGIEATEEAMKKSMQAGLNKAVAKRGNLN